jgi:mannose-1-phosphate guanylyltransferase
MPMIRRLVNRLAEGGVTDVVLALGFKPEPFLPSFLTTCVVTFE